MVSVYCERGYSLVGTQRMECHENGSYDVVTPQCRSSVRCPVPEIDNGYTGARGFVPEGETVFMACNYGLPNGYQSAKCLPTGLAEIFSVVVIKIIPCSFVQRQTTLLRLNK